jgi:hypothetical protein
VKALICWTSHRSRASSNVPLTISRTCCNLAHVNQRKRYDRQKQQSDKLQHDRSHPTRRRAQRDRIELFRSGAFQKGPLELRRRIAAPALGRVDDRTSSKSLSGFWCHPNQNLRLPRGRRRLASFSLRSTAAQAFGRALPLRDVFRDDARGFHSVLAELGVAGNLALHALALGMQEVAQAFQFGDQVLDFRQ